MDQSKFEDAQHAYETADYRSAAKLFLASAGKGAAGNGSAYHMAGNALMRLRRHHDAVTVYGHALRDETYDKRGAVHANLGAAYVSLGEYADAAREYESALEEPDYLTPYRAYQGMAAALIERGRVEDAAIAYRRAALDRANPDPGKALVNLGLCFMALGRPEDAVEAYRAALGFDDYQGRGKALANLGQALVALGQYDMAVKAFEKSVQYHGYKLSAAAQQSYEQALSSAGPARDTFDGWETGEMPIAFADLPAVGWETSQLEALSTEVLGSDTPAATHDRVEDARADAAAAALGMGDDDAVTEFFNLTEDEMRIRDREARRAQRQQRGARAWLVPLVSSAIAVVLIGLVLGVAYWFGYGWPSQRATVDGLMASYSSGQPVERYWVAVPDKDVAREMAKLPPVRSFAIDAVARGRDTSAVNVTVTPNTGAALHYIVTLAREGVGWKVSGVENDWRSSGG